MIWYDLLFVLDWNHWGEAVRWCFHHPGGGRGACGDLPSHGRNGPLHPETGVRCKSSHTYCRDINKSYIGHFVWLGLRKKNEARHDFKLLSHGKAREKKLGPVWFCLQMPIILYLFDCKSWTLVAQYGKKKKSGPKFTGIHLNQWNLWCSILVSVLLQTAVIVISVTLQW